MSVPSPAAPSHLLRLHSHPINTLEISPDNKRIYSGDSSGLVVTTSSHTLRAITRWQAHSDGLLGIEEWKDQIITHGRDNKLHVWSRVVELPESARLGDTAARLDLPIPLLSYSLDVNALNFCRFSLMRDPTNLQEKRAMLALPGLIDSSVVDIWMLPSQNRIHAAVGQETRTPFFSPDPMSGNRAGIIMALHLFSSPMQSDETCHDDLRLICAYENGSVTLRRYASAGQGTSLGGVGWEVLWTAKLHAESVMAMRISRQNNFAISVSVDHLVCRYDLSATASPENVAVAYKTKHRGNSSIAITDDGKVCAIGGWDGSIRLYSARTLKSLGTLKYHKNTCYAVMFARSLQSDRSKTQLETETGSDDEMSVEGDRWLIGGGKDCRVSVWSLMRFSKS